MMKVQETQNARTQTKNKSIYLQKKSKVMKLVVIENPKFVKLMTEISVTAEYRLVKFGLSLSLIFN